METCRHINIDLKIKLGNTAKSSGTVLSGIVDCSMKRLDTSEENRAQSKKEESTHNLFSSIASHLADFSVAASKANLTSAPYSLVSKQLH